MFLLKDPIEIIAISYHRALDFELCISSIISNTTMPYKLTIIDNSNGALDNELNALDQNVRIIRNPSNWGKGKSFKFWYNHITKKNDNELFVSLDADVIVPNGWLESMCRDAHEISNLGALAPTFVKSADDLNKNDPYDGLMYMHVRGNEINKNIFHSPKTAGPLLLINKKFYDDVGGYPGDCLYGHDDGYICKMAVKSKRFIGYTESVVCIHSNLDCPHDYTQWKLNNVNKKKEQGYWDKA